MIWKKKQKGTQFCSNTNKGIDYLNSCILK